MPVRVSGKSSISRARTRLGTAPFEALCRAQVEVVADSQTRGAWYRGRRLVAFDGSTLDVPDESENRETFGLPGSGRGQAAFPQVRLTCDGGSGHAGGLCLADRGPLRESEEEQAEALLSHLTAGMLVLADRGYFGFPNVATSNADRCRPAVAGDWLGTTCRSWNGLLTDPFAVSSVAAARP